MSAHIKTDISNDTVSVYCESCFKADGGVFREWPLCNSGVRSAEDVRDAHNQAKHPAFKPAILTLPDMTKEWVNPLLEFMSADEPRTILKTSDFNGHTPEPTADEIVDNIKEWANKIKRLQVNALKRENAELQTVATFRVRENIRLVADNKALDEQVTKTTSMLGDAIHENDVLKATLEKNRQVNDELTATIAELMETPDPMPLCKNLDGHNYLPLDHMFVFCNRCGHSIHYKTK